MTDQEKIDLGLCTAQTDSITGEVTIIPYTDEEIANIIPSSVIVEPTIEELKEQLKALQDKINLL